MKVKTAVLLLLSLLIMLIGSACKSSTSPKKGMVTGIVQLEGEADHSGVTVSIYQAGIVPDEVTNILQEYPQIAFPVTDKVVFDHREQTLLQTVYTDQEGKFIFTNLPYDEYIIVYRKESWGYNYLFEVVLDGTELDLSSNTDLTLYPEQILPGYIDGPFTLESNKCYVADSDVVISPNAHLIFKDNSRLLLSPYVKISSQGSIEYPTAPLRAYITSYAGIQSGTISGAQMGEGLVINGGCSEVQNLSFSFLRNALKIASNNVEMKRLSFRKCIFGLVVNACSDISISQCFIANNTDINAGANYAYDVHNYTLSNNLYFDNYIASQNELMKNGLIENNAFIGNSRGFLNLWESIAVIRLNYIKSDGIGIENSGKSNLEIYNNEIECKVCVKTYHTLNWYNTVNYGWTKAKDNNFSATQYAVESRAYYYYPDGPYPLDFKNNYWETTDTGKIDELIVDYNDLGLEGGSGVTSLVNYLPFRTSKVANAGIQAK